MFRLMAKDRPIFAMVACLFALCLAYPGQAESAALDHVVESGELRVAMSVDQPPFNMRNKDKVIIGFDVDLAQALADAMHVELKIVEIPFGDLLSALLEGKVDVAISGISITPERTRRVSFVGPYTLSGKSILTTARIKEVAKDGSVFNDAEIRIVALNNSKCRDAYHNKARSFVLRSQTLHVIGTCESTVGGGGGGG